MSLKLELSEEEMSRKLYTCPNCELELKDGQLLPCGLYCGVCVETLKLTEPSKKVEVIEKINDESQKLVHLSDNFELVACIFCKEDHMQTNGGFKKLSDLNQSKHHGIKFNIDSIYRGDAVAELKTSLKELEKATKKFEMKVNNGVDFIKEYCTELKNQVQLDAECLLNNSDESQAKIHQEEKNLLLKRIEEYEAKLIGNYTVDQRSKNINAGFIESLAEFNSKWCKNLKQLEFNESRVLEARGMVRKKMEEIRESSQDLDTIVFGEKRIYYENIETGQKMGSLKHQYTEKIDFKNLTKINLNKCLSDFYRCEDIGLFDDDRVVILYKTKNDNYRLVVLDSKNEIVKSVDYNEREDHSQSLIKTVGNEMLLFLCGRMMLQKLDSNLNVLKQFKLREEFFLSLDVDDGLIYALSGPYASYIKVFDWELKFLRTVGQHRDFKAPFFIASAIERIAHRSKKFYLFELIKVTALDEQTGLEVKSMRMNIEVQTMRLNATSIFRFRVEAGLINVVNIQKLDEGSLIHLRNMPKTFNEKHSLDFFVQNERFLFLDRKTSDLYIA